MLILVPSRKIFLGHTETQSSQALHFSDLNSGFGILFLLLLALLILVRYYENDGGGFVNEAIVKYVGERIRLYRKNSGMSMEEMARKINKSKASISKYEAGKIAIDIVTLFDIAEALNISPFQLFDYVLPSQARSNAAKNPFGETNKIYLSYD
mgnify:CR=1 FL=1